MLSSEHDWQQGSKQYQWLEKDLSRVDRRLFPWIVITTHRPAYNSEAYAADHRVSQHMKAELDSLLLKHSVSLFLAGHYHSYERTCAVSKNKCMESESGATDAPVHITVGAAGATLDSVSLLGKPWSMLEMNTYGFLNLRVKGSEEIIGEFWGLPLN